MTDKTIAIAGAGVAGLYLACLLGEQKRKVLLFDHKAPWEKPCGGGLTYKVHDEFPDIISLNIPMRENRSMVIITPFGRRTSMTTDSPITAVSRKNLARALLDRAVSAGAEFHSEKILSLSRSSGGIRLKTSAGEYMPDFTVGADGVHSIVRKTFASPFAREDLCLTYGMLYPVEAPIPLTIKFYTGFDGYAWLFPRTGGTSVGIALEHGGASRELVLRTLREFIADEWKRAGLAPPPETGMYARMIPSLRRESFLKPVVAGDVWALVGDASGSADPVTGEGIYYALKTAKLLADSILADDVKSYPEKWFMMSEESTGKVSKVVDRFYTPRTLRIMGLLLDYSPTARALIRDLIGGSQSYWTLKPRVYEEWPRYVREGLWNIMTFRKGTD